jgi:hypothetical protein
LLLPSPDVVPLVDRNAEALAVLKKSPDFDRAGLHSDTSTTLVVSLPKMSIPVDDSSSHSDLRSIRRTAKSSRTRFLARPLPKPLVTQFTRGGTLLVPTAMRSRYDWAGRSPLKGRVQC